METTLSRRRCASFGYTAACMVTLILGCSSVSNGQDLETGIRSPVSVIRVPSAHFEASPTLDGRLPHRSFRIAPPAVTRVSIDVPRQQPPAASPGRSTTRKLLGAIVGGVGGFAGGLLLGSKIESGEWTNSESIVGPLVGAPVGGVTGGILGYKFLF